MNSIEHEDPPVEGGYTGSGSGCQLVSGRVCNRHSNCDLADLVSIKMNGVNAYHCDIDDCESCFVL